MNFNPPAEVPVAPIIFKNRKIPPGGEHCLKNRHHPAGRTFITDSTDTQPKLLVQKVEGRVVSQPFKAVLGTEFVQVTRVDGSDLPVP
jgi:hypothetical protein